MKEVRVATAAFKYNIRRYVDQAKAGQKVIVTNHGHDDFQLLPCAASSPPPRLAGLVDPCDYEGINLDEPAFESMEDDESTP